LANWCENDPTWSEIVPVGQAKDSPLDSPTKILDGWIEHEKAVENETVNNKVRNMENIEVLAKEMAASDIADIKAKREAFVKEHVASMRGLRAKGQLIWLDMSTRRYYRCNTCEAVFQADQPDGKYCPACRGSEIMEINLSEMIDQGTTVNGGLKVSNSGGIKLSTCQSLGLKTRGHVDDRCGGVPHVARFVQQRSEHQRDRQTDWTQPGYCAEVSELTGSPIAPEAIQKAKQT